MLVGVSVIVGVTVGVTVFVDVTVGVGVGQGYINSQSGHELNEVALICI